MKGLLLKDFLNQRYQLKLFIILFVFWITLAVTTKSSYMMAGFMPMLSIILTMNALAFDDKGKWDKFAATMPISCFDIVLSKYFFFVIVTLGGLVISFVVDLIMGSEIKENLLVCLVAFSIGLLICSIMIPIIYKMGIEKAKIVVMILIVIPVLCVSFLPSLHLPAPQISEQNIITAICFLPVVALIISWISVMLSEKIYKNKEF